MSGDGCIAIYCSLERDIAAAAECTAHLQIIPFSKHNLDSKNIEKSAWGKDLQLYEVYRYKEYAIQRLAELLSHLEQTPVKLQISDFEALSANKTPPVFLRSTSPLKIRSLLINRYYFSFHHLPRTTAAGLAAPDTDQFPQDCAACCTSQTQLREAVYFRSPSSSSLMDFLQTTPSSV